MLTTRPSPRQPSTIGLLSRLVLFVAATFQVLALSARDHVDQRVREVRERGNDRGDILQTVVIVGLFVAAAVVIVGIIVSKATDAATSVKTQ